MREQIKREDVIRGLKCCTKEKGICQAGDCPYNGDCIRDNMNNEMLLSDALSLLMEQVPRVLSYDEARYHAMQFMNPDSVKPLFIEFRIKDDEDEEAMRPPWRGGYNQRLMLMDQKDRYMVDFRFWTDRPTKELMEATAWG